MLNKKLTALDSSNEHHDSVPDWDYNSFFKRIGKKNERAVMLMSSYIETVPDDIDELSNAINRSDIDTIKHLAHRAKGAAGIFSAKPLAELLKAIEEQPEQAKRYDTALNITLANLLTAMKVKLSNLQD